VTPDYYAALGLSPTSEDVVIRAAYLALMRRYHPDGNPSEVAAARARAINAAYAVLGDPDKRAEYDQTRAEEAWALGPDQRPPSTAPKGLFPAAAMMLALLLVFLVVWSPLPLVEPPRGRPQVPSRAAPAKAEPAVTRAENPVPADAPAVRPELVEEEPAPPVQLGMPAPAPSPPLTTPPPRLLAQARPMPKLSPPPKAHPVLQPAVAQARPQPKPPLRTASQPTASQPAPGLSCRGQSAFCTNANLANLDRLQALHYSQSLGRADAPKRALLHSTRDRFVARRDACRSVSCTRDAYLARMREVSDIMTAH
jgi:hypothetical protein